MRSLLVSEARNCIPVIFFPVFCPLLLFFTSAMQGQGYIAKLQNLKLGLTRRRHMLERTNRAIGTNRANGTNRATSTNTVWHKKQICQGK